MPSLHLSVPIYRTTGIKKPKTHLVGMNYYRNAQYHEQNALKKKYHDLVAAQITPDITFVKFEVIYTLWYKRTCDGSNVIAVIEKFVLDALKEHGVIPDDNVTCHVRSTWTVAGKDPVLPRVEITVKEAV